MDSQKAYVVVPNWNGAKWIGECIESLLDQATKATIVVVENGSTDGSVELIETKYPTVVLIKHPNNLGFAAGVNSGITYALGQNAEYIALFNNDAIADKNWLKELIASAGKDKSIGITTGKLVSYDKTFYDSTGDLYTTWGYPYPRGRDEPISHKYDNAEYIFAASGGASLYKAELFKDIGLFDADFFAYNEDTDISFRAQLAGWKIYYNPRAIAYHRISQTGVKNSGFTHRQTMKNLPQLFWKNVPARLMLIILPRFSLMYLALWVGAFKNRQGWPATKGIFQTLALMPKTLIKRHHIQSSRKVKTQYIASMLLWDLPPHTNKLHRLRDIWWRLTRRHSAAGES